MDAGTQLRSRRLLRLLVRCIRLAHPLRWHLSALLGSLSVVTLALLVPTLLLVDIFWTRVLQGQPLTDAGAALLGLDAATAAQPELFDAPLRKTIARRATVITAGLLLISSPLFIGLWYYQVWILQRINHLLRLALVERLQALSLRFHADARVGDAIYRVYQDSAMVTQLIDVLVLTPLTAGGRFLFSLAIVFVFDPKLALLLASVWPPALVLGWWFSPRLRVAFRAAREANSSLTSRIQETLAGIKVVKAYGAEAEARAWFERDSRRAFAAAFAARSLLAILLVLIFTIVAGALLAASYQAALATRDGAELFAKRLLAAGAFTAWNVGLFSFFKDRFGDGTNAVRRLFRVWGRLQDIGVGLERVFEVLDTEPEVRDAPGAVPVPELRAGVRFAHVTFGYDPNRPVLHDVCLEARRGTVTAIVGPTGSGKSTLMALLLRLFDPQSGSITIDGADIRRFQLASLRRHVAIALQENVLFQTTIRDNIRYAVPAADDADVRAAARVACADDFIETLPDGYDTVLGERGSKLSAGQRQRLNVARTLLKNPSILVLDEPTAALDAATELELLRRLAAWGRERAILLVTHRLSTIRQADQIVLMYDGRIVECGAHAELMARGALYRRLVEIEERPPLLAAGG
jgi:ABC-type multidrug transport system fused ATPase/permease subunit